MVAHPLFLSNSCLVFWSWFKAFSVERKTFIKPLFGLQEILFNFCGIYNAGVKGFVLCKYLSKKNIILQYVGLYTFIGLNFKTTFFISFTIFSFKLKKQVLWPNLFTSMYCKLQFF